MKLGTAPLRGWGSAARFALPSGRPGLDRNGGNNPDRRTREKADGGDLRPHSGSNGSPHLWMGLWKFLTGV